MTKIELYTKINRLVSEYLGFETTLAGMSNKSKTELEQAVENLQKAVNLTKHSDAISKAYNSKEWEAMLIFGTEDASKMQDVRTAAMDLQEASAYWMCLWKPVVYDRSEHMRKMFPGAPAL